MESKLRMIISLSIIGLYITVVLSLLIWSMVSDEGDIAHFFNYLSDANVLLGPVGIILGYYLRKD